MRLLFALLILQSICFARDYHGAEYRTLESYQYGRFETRLKAGQGDGFLSSFFTYNDAPGTNWAEIDFEVLGRWNNNIDVNVIDEHGSHLRQHPAFQNLNLDYHNYAFEWTPDYVAWFLDGEEFYRQTDEHIVDLIEPGKLMMNIWNPVYADWVGIWDARILPRFAYYDWASYASYTPGAGNVGTDLNFTSQWLDDFDEADTTLWEKSHEHTWNGNQAMFVQENVVFQDGKMVLCLTDDEQVGMEDDLVPYALWARIITSDSIIVRFSEEVDQVTASNPGAYIISGVTVTQVSYWEDQRTVSLSVQGINPDTDYNLIVLGVRDQASPQNNQMGQVLAIDLNNPLELPIRINCAGPAAQGYMADQWWSPAVEYGHEGGNYQVNTQYTDIPGTELDTVMASSLNRYSRYNVRLAPGVFNVTLSFVENSYANIGDRIFELYVEDSLINAAIDVNALVGPYNLYQVNIQDLYVGDGKLELISSASIYGAGYGYAGPFLNSIEIDGEFIVGLDQPKYNPVHYSLDTVYPNPFNAEARIDFNVPESAWVDLTLYDIRGARVRQILSGNYEAGSYQSVLNGNELSSGVYVVEMLSTDFQQKRKILLLK